MKKLILILILSLLPAIAMADIPLGGYSSIPGSSQWQSGINTTAQNSQTLGQNLPASSGCKVGPNGQITYCPLEPLAPNSAFGYGGNTPLSQYLSQAYTILVTVGGLLAVVFLVVGGVRYMLSEASLTDKDKAKHQMWSAIWGLVIILGSFLILYSINPNLLTFKLDLPKVDQSTSNFSPTTGGLPTATVPSVPGTVGTSYEGYYVNQDNCNIVYKASGSFSQFTDWSSLMLTLRSGARVAFTDTTFAQQDSAQQAFLRACADASIQVH